ncbi:MAG: MerR family transcriptional regulator [Pseudobdellovibrio sp.]
MRNDKWYTISEVIKLTGATEFLLRTWELRYGLVKPNRTSTGRRLYGAEDVMRVSKIILLTQHGHKISHIAKLNLTELNKLEMELFSESEKLGLSSDFKSEVSEVFKALSATDWFVVKAIFESQRNKLKPVDYINNFILPVSQKMSNQSINQSIDLIQEHILSSLIKENLYSLKTKTIKAYSKIKILFATVEGDHHDIGLLISKSLAEAKGFQVMYLGSHVPKKELAESCLRLKPTHVVIGTTISAEQSTQDHLLKYVNFVDRHIPEKIQIWLGGYSAQNLSLNLQRSFKVIKTMSEYIQDLDNLKRELI